jgi:hypothetical protein
MPATTDPFITLMAFRYRNEAIECDRLIRFNTGNPVEH